MENISQKKNKNAKKNRKLAGAADDPELDEAIATVNALARDGLADTRSAVNALQPRPGPDDPDDAAGPAVVNAAVNANTHYPQYNFHNNEYRRKIHGGYERIPDPVKNPPRSACLDNLLKSKFRHKLEERYNKHQ